MDVTVVICTYNRCQILERALESVLDSIIPPSLEWEIVLVDNNSKDRTRAVVEGIIARRPGRIRYRFEPKQGLSNARNAGVAEAKGKAVAFTDDDVAVDPHWLYNLTAPLLDDRCAGTAGRILLGDAQLPPWLATSGPHNLGGALVQFDLGEETTLLDRPPFGASMAFQRKVFGEYGCFRPDLGRSGKSLIGNEDTEFGMRLIKGGLRLLYVPSAVVYHPVLKERLTKHYFRSYWFSLGRAMVRQDGSRVSFWKVPRVYAADFKRRLHWMFREDPKWYRSPQGRFFCEVHALQAIGQIIEGWNQWTRNRHRT